ncbi:MAG: hypothetical protein J6P98_00345 [Clostridia bacterium]|nr:hypothetical protein [Clostridia bacterium]
MPDSDKEVIKKQSRSAKHCSINSFAVKAIGEHLDRLLRPREHDFTLDDIRTLFREELRDMDFAPREQTSAFIPPADMTEEEKEANDRNVLETLDMFS